MYETFFKLFYFMKKPYIQLYKLSEEDKLVLFLKITDII